MFHPVVKSACSYLNRSFCPHCFFLQFSLLFAIRHDVYYHKPKEKSTKFPAYSAQRGRQKIVYDTNQKSKPHVALCGAFVGKGKPLGGNKTTPDRATQRLYEPQPLSGLWSWVMGLDYRPVWHSHSNSQAFSYSSSKSASSSM